MKLRLDWFLLAILLTAWGLNYTVVKIGLSYSTPLAFSFYRVALGLLASIPLAVQARRSASKIKNPQELRKRGIEGLLNPKFILIVALFGATSTAIFLGFWFSGETLVAPGITAVIIYTNPLFTIVLSRLFLAESLTSWKVIGIAIGFVGIFFVVTNGDVSGMYINLTGFAMLLTAAISFAASMVLFKKWLTHYERNSLNTLQLAFAAVILFVWVGVSDFRSLFSTNLLDPIFLASLFYVAIIGTTVALLIWMFMLEKHGPVWLASWLFLVPVIAIIFASVFLGERIQLLQLVGSGIVVLSIVLVNRQK